MSAPSTITATKPSGIPWLGEVPAHWAVLRVKDLVDKSKYYQIGDGDHGSIKPEYYVDEGIPYIRVQNLSWHGKLDTEGLVFIPEEIHRKNLKSRLLPGDILIAKTGATVGKLLLLNEEVSEANTTSSVGKVSVDVARFDPCYILYAFQSDQFQSQIWLDAQQKSAQPGFNIDDLVLYRLVVPPLPEQRAIAAFLEERTARIDGLIARKQRLVQLLKEKRQALITRAVTRGLDAKVKLKESGVPWLGEVPEHWGVKRFKHVVSVWGRIGFRGYTTDDLVDEGQGALALGASHIKDNGRVDVSDPVFLTWAKYYESPEIMITKDDLIVVQRGSVGKVAHVDVDLGLATINPSLVLLKNAKANPRFLLYVLLGGYIQSKITTLLNATAVPMLSQEQVGNFDLLLPPRPEQDAIVQYVDRNTTRIDALITKVEQAVLRLQEYRTALISAAVTGKVRVG